MNITSIKKQNKTLNHKATGLVTLKLGKKNIHIVLLVNRQTEETEEK